MSDWLEGQQAVNALLEATEASMPVTGLKLRRADCSGLKFDGLILAESELEDIRFENAFLERTVFTDCRMTALNLDGAWVRHATFFQTPMHQCTARGAHGYRWTLAEGELVDFDASDARLVEARFTRTSCKGVTLVGANLSHAVFVMTPHEATDFTRAQLQQAVLHDLDLTSCLFRDIDATMVVFSSSKLDGLDLSGATLTRAQCSKTSLQNTNLAGAELTGACFVDAKLNGARLEGSQLPQAAFMRAQMNQVCLDNADLTQARLIRCDLQQASLKKVEAKQSIWHLSKLNQADLRDTNLFEADLIGADFTGADLRGVTFRRARLDRIVWEDAKFDSSAKALSRAEDDVYAGYIMAAT